MKDYLVKNYVKYYNNDDFERCETLIKRQVDFNQLRNIADKASNSFMNGGGVEMDFDKAKELHFAFLDKSIELPEHLEIITKISEAGGDATDEFSEIRWSIIDEIQEKYDGEKIGTPIKVSVLDVHVEDYQSFKDPNCINFFLSAKVVISVLDIEWEGFVSLRFDKETNIASTDDCQMEMNSLFNDLEREYIYDDLEVSIYEALDIVLCSNEKVLEASKGFKYYKNGDKVDNTCPYCGEEMEWEMDFSNAQWTPGDSIANLDDCIEGGGYVCGNEDCIESLIP